MVCHGQNNVYIRFLRDHVLHAARAAAFLDDIRLCSPSCNICFLPGYVLYELDCTMFGTVFASGFLFTSWAEQPWHLICHVPCP